MDKINRFQALYVMRRVRRFSGRFVWQQSQVKAMMRSTREVGGRARDGRKATVLHAATNSGSRGTFNVVLAALRERLTPEEVWGSISSSRLLQLLREACFGRRLHFRAAIELGGFGVVRARGTRYSCTVRATLRGAPPQPFSFLLNSACVVLYMRCPRRMNVAPRCVTPIFALIFRRCAPKQVREIMVSTGVGDESILQCAAESGSKGVFEAVLASLVEQLTREEASTPFSLLILDTQWPIGFIFLQTEREIRSGKTHEPSGCGASWV